MSVLFKLVLVLILVLIDNWRKTGNADVDVESIAYAFIRWFCIEDIFIRPQPGEPGGVYRICLCPSVCLSVRPSVRHANHTTLCPWHFGMKRLSWGSETSHSERIYIAGVQRRGFSFIDQKLSKLRGSELGRIWAISRNLYITLFAAFWYEAFVLGLWNFTQ